MFDSLFHRTGPKLYISDEGTVIHTCASIVNPLGRDAIHLGAFTHVKGELLTFGHGGKISIGDYCYFGEGGHIWSSVRVTIGNRVLISHNVNIFDSQTHPLSAKLRHEHFKQIINTGHPRKIDLGEKPVVIGDDVWIGCMSVILRGVCIGTGAIIGAGSVVTRDVDAWTIVAGNPARLIREIPPDER